jgi:hypothetical protein
MPPKNIRRGKSSRVSVRSFETGAPSAKRARCKIGGMGIITTKVKADGRFFMASIDRGTDGQQFRDAHPPLEKGKVYWGHLFDGSMVVNRRGLNMVQPRVLSSRVTNWKSCPANSDWLWSSLLKEFHQTRQITPHGT